MCGGWYVLGFGKDVRIFFVNFWFELVEEICGWDIGIWSVFLVYRFDFDYVILFDNNDLVIRFFLVVRKEVFWWVCVVG